MAKRIENLKVVGNKILTGDFCVLELESEQELPDFRPGQFIQVKVDGSPETFLRRPISVHDVDFKRNRYKMLVQVLGKGTETLYKLKSGDSLDVVHPLGNAFSDPEGDGKILLIGGGTGIAPLLFLGKYLNVKGFEVEYLLGFRNKSRAILIEEYRKVGKVHLTTEDGSIGEKGFVTMHSVLKSQKISKIYCCGPDPMMHAVAELCYINNIPCEVSLENLMACGFGICLCCIVDTTRGNICTCTEGPVFNINELKWRTSE
jgi:dihydroorotate dehydrogenase electron transfer subunit